MPQACQALGVDRFGTSRLLAWFSCSARPGASARHAPNLDRHGSSPVATCGVSRECYPIIAVYKYLAF